MTYFFQIVGYHLQRVWHNVLTIGYMREPSAADFTMADLMEPTSATDLFVRLGQFMVCRCVRFRLRSLERFAEIQGMCIFMTAEINKGLQRLPDDLTDVYKRLSAFPSVTLTKAPQAGKPATGSSRATSTSKSVSSPLAREQFAKLQSAYNQKYSQINGEFEVRQRVIAPLCRTNIA